MVKLRPVRFKEIQKHVICNMPNMINEFKKQDFVIIEGKLFKKYLVHEDQQQYTKSRNYNRLLRNIIRSRCKLEKKNSKIERRELFKKPSTKINQNIDLPQLTEKVCKTERTNNEINKSKTSRIKGATKENFSLKSNTLKIKLQKFKTNQ